MIHVKKYNTICEKPVSVCLYRMPNTVFDIFIQLLLSNTVRASVTAVIVSSRKRKRSYFTILVTWRRTKRSGMLDSVKP